MFDVAEGKAPARGVAARHGRLPEENSPFDHHSRRRFAPWTDAVQFLVRDDQGGEKPLPLALKPLVIRAQHVELDTIIPPRPTSATHRLTSRREPIPSSLALAPRVRGGGGPAPMP